MAHWYGRNPVACTRCRRLKVKCRVDRHDAPCQKCLRDGSECIYVSVGEQSGDPSRSSNRTDVYMALSGSHYSSPSPSGRMTPQGTMSGYNPSHAHAYPTSSTSGYPAFGSAAPGPHGSCANCVGYNIMCDGHRPCTQCFTSGLICDNAPAQNATYPASGQNPYPPNAQYSSHSHSHGAHYAQGQAYPAGYNGYQDPNYPTASTNAYYPASSYSSSGRTGYR